MTKEQALNYLKSSGFSKEQIQAIVGALGQEPTTKNDLPHCQCTDTEIAKSFIEDVEAVKDQLPCGEQMDFPNTFDEFAKDYGFKDKDEVYTNGSELIPVFRVKQWLEHISTTKNDIRDNRVKNELNRVKNELEPTTKNDLGVDAISREKAIAWAEFYIDIYDAKTANESIIKMLRDLPSAKNDLGVDAVSRQAINGYIDYILSHGMGKKKSFDFIKKFVASLPLVTPQEPRKGHWIKGYKFPDGEYWRCDKCNELIKVKYPMHYCNNCGSDNREVEE